LFLLYFFKGIVMNLIAKLFTPFEYVDKKVLKTIAVFQVLLLIFCWAFLVPVRSFFPNLPEVLSAWKSMWQNGLFYHILATLKLCGTATLISIIVSSVVAYSSVIPFFKPFVRFISSLRYNPIQGFTLFLTTATGGGRNLQITLLVIFMSFYFITALESMIQTIPEEDYYRRKAQRMGRWQILWKVVIVDRADYLLEIIRQNLSITFMMIVSVEAMDKSLGGLGALLVDTNRALNFPKIFALQLTIFTMGIILDSVLNFIFLQFPANKKL
jgi:ABC-type nitrate/sulfonate/bicarbonate transport system permease component